MGTSSVSVDEFQALEQKVLRAVEIVKREREARAAAEAEVRTLREKLAAQSAELQSRIEAAQSQAAEAQSRAEEAQSQLAVAQSEKEAALAGKEAAENQIGAFNHERDVVRQRVEHLLLQMDELL